MSIRWKVLVLSLTILALSSCNSSSSSGEKTPVNPGRSCVPESELEGIVGGDRVSSYDYDSNRVVMLLSRSAEGMELCTAAPIAPDVLLTAAHCITASAAETYAFTKSAITCEAGFNFSRDAREVVAVVVNENYSELDDSRMNKIKSDVALVFLKEKLPTNYPVYKIADSEQVAASGSDLYLYGYGTTALNRKASGILRKTQIQPALYSINKTLQEVKVDQTAGRGVCSGDSGGPGLVMINGELQILGVNSYVAGKDGTDICRNQGNLALADYYTSWIENKMSARGRSLRK